jgi:glycosyltransferase involved in cell wall biosynthesis
VYKKNVLIVTHSLHIGGLEIVIANLCRHIDKEKFNISICCLKEIGSVGKELVKEGYSVKVFNPPRWLKNNYFSWLQLYLHSKEKNINILHSHTLDSLFDSVLCRFFNKKIKTVHTFHYGNYPKLPAKYILIEKIFCRFVDKLVSVGNVQKEKIIETFKIDKKSIITVWNGVPKIKGEPSLDMVEQYREKDRIIIGTVCTLIEQKGLSKLIDVASEIKKRSRKALFLIAGEGHLRAPLEEKVRKLGLKDEVKFIGWVDNPCYTFLPYIDIFFLPSLWEAMSVVVLEAMEAGKPVVVTDVGDNRFVIEDGVDGFLACPGKIQQMTDIIIKLIEDYELRVLIGEKARNKIREHFSVEKMVSAYEVLYTNG